MQSDSMAEAIDAGIRAGEYWTAGRQPGCHGLWRLAEKRHGESAEALTNWIGEAGRLQGVQAPYRGR